MQYIRGLYDSSTRRLMVEFSNSNLKKHWDLFSDLINEASKKDYLPRETEYKLVSDDKALIIFPCELKTDDDVEDGARIKNSDLPEVVTDHLSNLLETFAKRAMELEMDELEFIPLQGYPVEKMKEDIEQAIRDKRDLCLIDTYRNYELLGNKEITETRQKRIPYLNNEYADIAYYIWTGNLGELKKYKAKLEKKTWI